jgi:DNA polymerase elongation subunit (family B)
MVQLETDGSVQTVRRDNCRLVQTVIETCLHKMLIDRDVKGAEEYVFSARKWKFYAFLIDSSSQ